MKNKNRRLISCLLSAILLLVMSFGFGTFAVSKRAARTGRNPQTGAVVNIAARNAVTFKAGAALKESVN